MENTRQSEAEVARQVGISKSTLSYAKSQGCPVGSAEEVVTWRETHRANALPEIGRARRSADQVLPGLGRAFPDSAAGKLLAAAGRFVNREKLNKRLEAKGGKIQSVPKYRQLPKVDPVTYYGPSTQDGEIAFRSLPGHLRAVLNGQQVLDILRVAWPGLMAQDGKNVRPSKSAVIDKFKDVLREYNGIDLGAALTDIWGRSAAFDSAVGTQEYLGGLACAKLSELLYEKGRIEESLAAKEQVTDIDRLTLRHKRCLALEADLRAKLSEIQAKIDGMRTPARSENLTPALTINF